MQTPRFMSGNLFSTASWRSNAKGVFCPAHLLSNRQKKLSARPQPTYARLSNRTIKYGAEIQGLSVHEIAAHLYMFNRAPSTPLLQRRFAETEQVITYLVGDSR